MSTFEYGAQLRLYLILPGESLCPTFQGISRQSLHNGSLADTEKFVPLSPYLGLKLVLRIQIHHDLAVFLIRPERQVSLIPQKI